MKAKPKQMTLYFNADDEAMAKQLETIAKNHPAFDGNENRLVRHCIEYAIKNDKFLKEKAA